MTQDRTPDRERKPRAPSVTIAQAKKPDENQRIAKVMARAGLCSRRDAEGWIEQGRVEVNGLTLASPAFNVQPGDRVIIDGKPLAARERTRLFAFHKPRGFVTTDRDPEGRPTIFDHLATITPMGTDTPLPRVVTIGRLDINTEGLLLLTNDGGLARVLELPSTGWLRRYRVRANGTTDQAVLDTLKHGVTIDGVDYIGIEATLDRVQGANVWLTMGLREGKNREIKRVLEHLGLAVTRLIRVSFGPFQLEELGEGEVEEIKTRVLRDQLGPRLEAEAGADFNSPVAGEEDAPGKGRGAPGRKIAAWPDASIQTRDRPDPGARKHVSVMREERAGKDRSGPRAKVQSTATEDRKGRTVRVERVVTARSRDDAEPSRNARRFAGEKADARPPRGIGKRGPVKHFRGGDSAVPAEKPKREYGPRRTSGEYVPERKPRGEGLERPGGGFRDKRPGPPREAREGREDRPPRRFDGDGPERGGEAPSRPSGSFRGARRFSASGKPFTEGRGPPRSGPPRGERPGGGKPEGRPPRGGGKPGGSGKPGGASKTFGKRPPRDRG